MVAPLPVTMVRCQCGLAEVPDNTPYRCGPVYPTYGTGPTIGYRHGPAPLIPRCEPMTDIAEMVEAWEHLGPEGED